MDFDYTDEQEQLRDAVRRWVDKGYGFERRQQIVKKQGGFSAEAWTEMAELGLMGLAVSDAHGGMGFGPVEAMVVMEELGRGLVLEPYAPVALVAASILAHSKAPQAAERLAAIADGSQRIVLAHQERAARYRLNHVTTTASSASGSWTISGAKSVVPTGAHAHAFIVPARVEGAVDDASGIALFLVDRAAAGVKLRGYPTQDGACAAELSLADTPAVQLLPAGEAFGVLELAADVAIAALCAEAVGAMDKLLGITAEYLNTRKQFGVPIASFQALRHRMSDMKMQLELARSMSYFATLKLAAPAAERRRALSQAKVQLGQSMRFVGQQSIQLHGGIGVTEEYSAGHYFKRLTVIEMSFGDTLHHLGEVSARMHDTAGVFA
ncbi:acyl-CoA dehydrogenase family protein [Caldimonas sp. KR1-144]|uniref:acyl-CoA dehydrogenase family protein n=1 Tax=Caldimonas sp. KR1-144 TaxID=3400911 RepID=UPI003C075E62